MRLSAFLHWANFITIALAIPAHEYVTHEKRDDIPLGWEWKHKLDANFLLPLRIGLTQSNLEKLEDFLMEVSLPNSPKWGQHWTPQEIAETFVPSPEAFEAARNWLASAGIAADRVRHSMSLGWLHVNATVAEAEQLLRTEYHMYEHESGTLQVACNNYKVPESIREHIDIITPTIHFDAKVRAQTASNIGKRSEPGSHRGIGSIPIAIKGHSYPNMNTLSKKLKNCTDYITPACLRALYEIPAVTTNLQTNPLGVVEFNPQNYYQPDLDLFFNTFQPKQKQTTPNLASVDGGFVSSAFLGPGYESEGNLDLEYAMALSDPITTTVFMVGDGVEIGTFDTFLDAIDGSFCTFEGGDDPNYDPKFPDPYTNYGGPDGEPFEGPQNCGGFKAPKVISTSYGFPTEYWFSKSYQIRQCAEYAKLGLAGTSVLYASGDSGVGLSAQNSQCLGKKSTFGEPKYVTSGMSRFTVGFPANCPYVTTVGGTMVKPNTSILDANPEEAANVLIPTDFNTTFHFASGGGFSDLFPMPKYQQAAMKHYFDNHEPSYPTTRYNASRSARGLPDVSANGANYIITTNGTFSLIYGTSASCPTFASIIAIINEQRKIHNKKSLGFLNPMLYANPDVLKDITEGRNPGCGTEGFEAVEGWDPVTGLGTPDVPRMVELFLGVD